MSGFKNAFRFIFGSYANKVWKVGLEKELNHLIEYISILELTWVNYKEGIYNKDKATKQWKKCIDLIYAHALKAIQEAAICFEKARFQSVGLSECMTDIRAFAAGNKEINISDDGQLVKLEAFSKQTIKMSNDLIEF